MPACAFLRTAYHGDLDKYGPSEKKSFLVGNSLSRVTGAGNGLARRAAVAGCRVHRASGPAVARSRSVWGERKQCQNHFQEGMGAFCGRGVRQRTLPGKGALA